MTKKGFLKNDNEIMLPITRGELVLDSSGQQAFHSGQFLANEDRHGLMSNEDKINIKNIIEKTNDLDTDALNLVINSIKDAYLKSVKVDNNKLTITDQSNTETNFYNTIYTFESGTDGSFTVKENGGNSQTITVGGTLTDEKVGQKNITDNKEYRILLSNSNNDNDEVAPSNKSGKLLFNPSTGTLTATAFNGKVTWGNIDNKPETFTPETHNHSTNQIFISNEYTKFEESESISSTDILTKALGKLEYKADLGKDAWDWISSTISDTNDNNTTIDRLKEIFDILKDINETDTIKSIIGNYLPLNGGILLGDLTFGAGSNDRYLTFSSSTTSKDATHSYRFGYLGSGTGENNLFVLQGSKTTSNAWSNIFSITAESLNFKFEVPVNTGRINLVGNQSIAMGDNYINLYNSATNAARIGTNQDNALGLYSQGIIYIRPKMSSTFDTSNNGLVISDTTFTYNGYSVLHGDNYSTFTLPVKTITESKDASTLTESGIYKIQTTAMTNMPTTNWGILNSINNSNYLLQQFYTDGNPSNIYIRRVGLNSSSTTSNWRQVAFLDNVMTFDNGNSNYLGANFVNKEFSKKASSTYIEFWDSRDDSESGWFNSKWGKVIAVNGFEGNLTGMLNIYNTFKFGVSGLQYFQLYNSPGTAVDKNQTPLDGWWHIIRMNHANSQGYMTELASPFNGDARQLYWRTIYAKTNSGWYSILDQRGGNLTGSIICISEDYSVIPIIRNIKFTQTTGWARKILAMQVDGVEQFSLGAYGYYNFPLNSENPNKADYLYLGFGGYNGNSLRVYPDGIKFGNETIWHSGNCNFLSSTNKNLIPAGSEITNAKIGELIGYQAINKSTWAYANNGYIETEWGKMELAGSSILSFGTSSAYTQLFISAPSSSRGDGLTNEMMFYNNHGSTYSPGWTRVLTNRNYTDYINETNFPGIKKTGTVTSVTVTGTNGLSGSGTITTSGTITLSNSGVRSTVISGNYLRVNTNGTNADLTIPYATSAGSVNAIKVTETNPTSETSYYPIWTTGYDSSTNYTVRANDSLRLYIINGTTSKTGQTVFQIGNTLANNTANNKQGVLRLCGPSSYYATIFGPNTATGSFYLPNTGGTLITHATRGTAVGGTARPVYITSTSRATACTWGTSAGTSTTSYYITAVSGTTGGLNYNSNVYINSNTVHATNFSGGFKNVWVSTARGTSSSSPYAYSCSGTSSYTFVDHSCSSQANSNFIYVSLYLKNTAVSGGSYGSGKTLYYNFTGLQENKLYVMHIYLYHTHNDTQGLQDNATITFGINGKSRFPTDNGPCTFNLPDTQTFEIRYSIKFIVSGSNVFYF